MTHDHMQAAVLAAMERGEDLPEQARRHARGCDLCGPWLDHVLTAERALEGGAPLSGRALDALEMRVMERLPVRRVPPVAAWVRALFVAAPLALVAGAALLWMPRQLALTPRGLNPELAGSSARVRVLCVGADGVKADVRSDAPQAQLHCGLHDVLAFTVTRDASNTAGHLFLVGTNAAGEPRWYHPRPEEERSVALPQSPVTDHPLSGVRLEVNHAPGVTRVLAIFTAQPLSVDWVRDGMARGALADVLPADALVHAVEVHIP